LTNGIHLLRTLCPDDPPEAAELLDYFDSTYISGKTIHHTTEHSCREAPNQAAVSVAMMLVSGGRKKKLLSVLLSSKMPSVIHQLSVLNRDMFSSRSVYRTYAETSLLARRPLPSTCVELGGTSDSITNISA
jgi:hypothetical protein